MSLCFLASFRRSARDRDREANLAVICFIWTVTRNMQCKKNAVSYSRLCTQRLKACGLGIRIACIWRGWVVDANESLFQGGESSGDCFSSTDPLAFRRTLTYSVPTCYVGCPWKQQNNSSSLIARGYIPSRSSIRPVLGILSNVPDSDRAQGKPKRTGNK